MQSAPVRFLISLGYAMRSKRLRATALNACVGKILMLKFELNIPIYQIDQISNYFQVKFVTPNLSNAVYST